MSETQDASEVQEWVPLFNRETIRLSGSATQTLRAARAALRGWRRSGTTGVTFIADRGTIKAEKQPKQWRIVYSYNDGRSENVAIRRNKAEAAEEIAIGLVLFSIEADPLIEAEMRFRKSLITMGIEDPDAYIEGMKSAYRQKLREPESQECHQE